MTEKNSCPDSGKHCHATDMNDRLILNLRDLGHIMRLLYEGKASQKRVLIILNEAGAMTQRDLTERLGIQPGSASEILSKLERAGWIKRARNDADRRTTDVCLTEAGRELAAEALAQRQKRHEDMFSCLSEEERQELLSLLEKVCAHWKDRYSEKGNICRHGHCHSDCRKEGSHPHSDCRKEGGHPHSDCRKEGSHPHKRRQDGAHGHGRD